MADFEEIWRRGWALLFAMAALLIGTATVVGDDCFVSDALAGALEAARSASDVSSLRDEAPTRANLGGMPATPLEPACFCPCLPVHE